jgi:hypothetical protein
MAPSRRKAHGDRPRVTINGRALTPAQERRWRSADDDLASSDPNRVKRGCATLRLLEADLAADAACAQVRAGMDETARLERMRGERIEVSKEAQSPGRLRVRTRDGLETLAGAGAISQTQYHAGLLYRDLYEATDPERGLRSHMDDLDKRGGGAGGGDIAEAWAERRLRLSRAIADLEAKVRLADRNDRAVRALRQVAGHARCISHLSAGGGAQAAYRRALSLALDICAGHFRVG